MAVKGIGRLIQFGIAKETTRGTSPAAATFWVPFSELDLQEKFDNVIDEQSRGIIEDSMSQSRTKDWAEGSVGGPIEDKSFPLILYATFGTLATTTNADGAGTVKNHTITVAQSAQHQSLSFYIDDPLAGQDYAHALGMVDKLEIKYEQSKFIEFKADIKAKKGSAVSLSPSTTLYNRFLPQHLTFKVASTYATLSTGTAISLKTLTLSVAKNLESDDVLGSTAPADFLNKEFSIEGTVEALWQNESDFKTAALAGTVKALRLDLINTDVTIGSAANPEVRIDLAKVFFTEIAVSRGLKDLVKQTLKFKAHYSTTDSLMVSILCVNLQSSY